MLVAKEFAATSYFNTMFLTLNIKWSTYIHASCFLWTFFFSPKSTVVKWNLTVKDYHNAPAFRTCWI